MSIMEKNLPIASELAEGDYLRIVTSGGNSKQVLASAVGGGAVEQFVVTITIDEDDDTIITSDKTGTEILAELILGKQMVVTHSGAIMPYTFFELSPNNITIRYVNVITATDTMTVRDVVIPNNSTTGTATTYSYTLTPTP